MCKCIYCGEEFEQNRKGRKRTYCSKIECLRKAKNEIQRKWYANRIKVLEGSKTRIIEQKEEKKVAYSSADRAINSEKEDFSDVITIARELGAIRFKLMEEIKKTQQMQSKFDIQDSVFLHKIEEFAKQDVVYEDEIVQTVKEHIGKRQERRTIKDKQELYKRLLQGIITNPDAYVINFIKNRDKRTYKKEESLGIKEN